MAAEPAWRRELGHEARRIVESNYDAAANAHRLVELLTSIAGRANDR
jgi:hypothetical protein